MAMLDVIVGPMLVLPILLFIAIPAVILVTIIMAIVRSKKVEKQDEKEEE